MMRWHWLATILALNCLALGCTTKPVLYAQDEREFETSYNKRFLSNKSMLGKEAPDIGFFDADGNPFRLAAVRGKHTVVVFGCLT